MIFSSSILLPPKSIMSWFLIAEECSIVYMHIFFIHSSVEGQLEYFQFLTIMNKADVYMVEHFCEMLVNLLGISLRVVERGLEGELLLVI